MTKWKKPTCILVTKLDLSLITAKAWSHYCPCGYLR